MTPLSWQKAPSTSARAAAVGAVAVGAVAVGAVRAARVARALNPKAVAKVAIGLLCRGQGTPPARPSLFGRLAQMANAIKQRVTCVLSNTARFKVIMELNAAAPTKSASTP